MSLKDQADLWIRAIVGRHLASNIRSYKWMSYLGETRTNSLGGINYLLPTKGTIVDRNGQFTLVKTSPSQFCIVLNSLLADAQTSAPLAADIGDKVAMTFYTLRRWDGTAADGTEDPAEGYSRTMMLTGKKTYFPVRWEGRYLCINERFADSYREIRNPYLQDMIRQLEDAPVNGGIRRAVNVLIDAGGTDLDFVDPPEAKSVETPPAIRVRFANSKLTGTLEIFYDRPADLYGLRITRDADPASPEVIDDIGFEELPDALQVAVCEDKFLNAKVTVVKKAPRKRAVVETDVLTHTEGT